MSLPRLIFLPICSLSGVPSRIFFVIFCNSLILYARTGKLREFKFCLLILFGFLTLISLKAEGYSILLCSYVLHLKAYMSVIYDLLSSSFFFSKDRYFYSTSKKEFVDFYLTAPITVE